MKEFQLCITIILIFCFDSLVKSLPTQPTDDNSKLLLINTVFRHGDRTPSPKHESYPTDPYKNCTFYPIGPGQLTNKGKKRSYEFGMVLKRMYKDFLGDTYFQPNVYARCTPFTRTKMTLQIVLSALYPPTDNQIWNPELPWQPVNIVYTSERNGLLSQVLCPAFAQALTDVQQLPAVKAKEAEYNDLMKKVSVYTGMNVTQVLHLSQVHTILSIQSSIGLQLPKWTEGLFPDGQLYEANKFQISLLSYNENIIKVNGGILLKRMIDDMNKVINGTLPDLKINLFSAHDFNVIAILGALGIYFDISEYTSALIIELREKNGEYFVKFLHYLGIPSEILEVRIPGCDLLCPYNKFIKLTSAIIPTEQDPLCPVLISEDTDMRDS